MTTTGVCASCAQAAAEARAGSLVYVYGRYKGQKNFRPMNLKANVQVNATMRATRLSRADGERFVATESDINPEWEFELREVPVA